MTHKEALEKLLGGFWIKDNNTIEWGHIDGVTIGDELSPDLEEYCLKVMRNSSSNIESTETGEQQLKDSISGLKLLVEYAEKGGDVPWRTVVREVNEAVAKLESI
ncbi:MAG: hypothetical protein KC517_09350 [Bacteroidetes bacterium]|nr:hypothetical protein [Bacteroidota bacterium]